MTIKELSQLYYLNREIKREQCRLTELRTAATSTTARISGLPGICSISDKTAIAAMIADTETVIRAKMELAVVEYNRLNRYIASIPDSFTRQIIRLRFVDGLTWRQVAQNIGGNNTEDGVKKACYRFLAKNQSCPKCPEDI